MNFVLSTTTMEAQCDLNLCLLSRLMLLYEMYFYSIFNFNERITIHPFSKLSKYCEQRINTLHY